MKLSSFVKRHHPIVRNVPAELRKGVWARIAVCPRHRFIYLRIPKAANSTITKTLAARVFPERRQEFEIDADAEIAKKSFERLPLICFSRQRILKRFFVFSFFRNPFTRVLSAYLDKIASAPKPVFQWTARSMGLESTSEMSFENFVTFLENDNLDANVHWAPQVRICPFPVEELHFAGKIEQLERDLAIVMEKIFGAGSYGDILMREHNRQRASEKTASFYDESLIKRVGELYREDFDRLGYDSRRLP